MPTKTKLLIVSGNSELEITDWDIDHELPISITGDVTQQIYLTPKQVKELITYLTKLTKK